ncbi:MAG: UbiA family prenyltransferase [Chloroflexota bacterium]|nr:UbiA family prenyltransferase [Chloroflexota bacterium]
MRRARPAFRSPVSRDSGLTWRSVRGYLVLPHAVPVLVVMTATALFAFLATDGAPAPGELIRLLLAMLGGQLAIGAVNEIVDAELDAVAKPAKPIPAGVVSVRGALVVTGLGLAAMVGFSASFGLLSLALCALGTGAGLVYDLWLKRTLLAWLPYLVALPLLPVWVWTALVGFEASVVGLYPLGALAVIGVYLSQSLPDVASDRGQGIDSFSNRLGERRGIGLCWLATLSAPAFALVAADPLDAAMRWIWFAAGIMTALVGTDAGLYLTRPRLGVMACFPLVAASTAVMGLAWMLAIR